MFIRCRKLYIDLQATPHDSPRPNMVAGSDRYVDDGVVVSKAVGNCSKWVSDEIGLLSFTFYWLIE